MRLIEMSGHKFNAPQAGELLDILRKNCQPWIIASKWLPIYRGSKMVSQYDDFIKIKTRPDKQDPDIPKEIQQAFDRALAQRGHTALLKNSVHVTGNLESAIEYGRPFVIFPVGEFSISWSPIVKDGLYIKGELIANPKDLVKSYLDHNVTAAIKSGNEILVKCDEYYKVDINLWKEIT